MGSSKEHCEVRVIGLWNIYQSGFLALEDLLFSSHLCSGVFVFDKTMALHHFAAVLTLKDSEVDSPYWPHFKLFSLSNIPKAVQKQQSQFDIFGVKTN